MAVRDFVPLQISSHFNLNIFRPISQRTQIWIWDDRMLDVGRNLYGTKPVNSINRTKSVVERNLFGTKSVN